MIVNRDFRPFCLLVLFCIATQLAHSQELQPETVGSPNGQLIFLQKCASCHGVEGQGISAMTTVAGPSLQAVHNPGVVLAAEEIGPDHMPSFARVLSISQMQAVAEYVTQQLAKIPLDLQQSNVSDGGIEFRKHCAACHRTAVRGGALAFTGINAPSLTGKDAALIAGAIRSGPGPMPAFPSSEIDDQQLDSIVDYVKFVQNPPSPGGTPLNWYGPVAEGFVAWVMVLGLVYLSMWIERGGKG
jgi:ubiquinol-cytochrome c reductase cytochrome c subunit